uniref:DNA-directed DNA polymerase n=1 Tax=Davidia involucrata TaxID=16924 RepID=A0A5B7BSS7_DAVIN
MAMGISTQTSPFKSSCPAYFLLSRSFPRSPASASSRSSWASSKKALHRQEVCTLQSANSPFSNITVSSSSLQFKQSSSYKTMPISGNRRCDNMECHHPFSQYKLVVRAEATSPTSSASMLPVRPNQITSKRNLLFYEKFGQQKMTQEEKQEVPRHLHEPSNLKIVSEPIPNNSNTPSCVFSWLKESERLKKMRRTVYGVSKTGVQGELEGLRDGNTYESSKYFTDSSSSVLIKQDSSSSEFDDDIRDLNHPRQRDLYSSHISLKGFQTNGSLSEKLSDEQKETNPQTQMNRKEIIPNKVKDRTTKAYKRDAGDGKSVAIADDVNETYTKSVTAEEEQRGLRERLSRIYDTVLVVDNIFVAKKIVGMLTNQYKHLVHACDTEVAKIDVKQETPIDHGEIICFSIYSGPAANYGNGKSCIWVDVLDGGGRNLLAEFAPFFEDPSIKKVWHNYSFDNHVIENYGLKVSGFHADTMHMARLWDSSRRMVGGYSLEALTSEPKVMSGAGSCHDNNFSKVSMKTIFGRRKVKKDGSEGKIITIPPVEELQREERRPWICYSALDSINTLNLYVSLKKKLSERTWMLEGKLQGSMFGFYEKYWRPFGELLVKMETEGMLVDRAYLAEMEKVAKAEQQVATNRFRNWASRHCPDARYMNVGSDAQLRQLFFGGTANRKNPDESLPEERELKVPNIDKVIEEGKKIPTKYRTVKLKSIVKNLETEMYTASGWPSVSGDALKTLAGKVSAEFDFTDDAYQLQSDDSDKNLLEKTSDEDSKTRGVAGSEDSSTSAYGTAYTAFGGGRSGREACHAIAALCEVCSIDSLISNFILPLQGSHISGKNGRIHCSLNINTETGRLSARRPNLQNQPALEKDRYKIRQAFIAAPGNSLIVADYGQLELRILAHLSNCKSMLDAFKAGGDFHSRTAMNMYPHIREAVEQKQVLLEWDPQPGEDKPPAPLLKDAFASERRRAKMLNFSIAYGKTVVGLARDWKVSVKEAKEIVDLWYKERKEVLKWQEERKKEAHKNNCVHTLLGRTRTFPSMSNASPSQKGHIERAAINTPVQGSAADVAMCAMLEISKNARLKELGWRLLLQVHDEVILEGPTDSAELAKAIVVECMSKPFNGKNILNVDLSVDAKCAQDWYSAK